MTDTEKQKDARGMIKELLEVESGLTRWEINFIQNVDLFTGVLSPKRIKTIEKIYYRIL